MYYEEDLIIHDLNLSIDEQLQLESITAETDLTDFPEGCPEWIKTILLDEVLPF